VASAAPPVIAPTPVAAGSAAMAPAGTAIPAPAAVVSVPVTVPDGHVWARPQDVPGAR